MLETHGVMGAKGLPDDVREYLGALVLLSWIGKASGILIAILGVVFAFLRPQQRAGKVRLVPAVAVSITFGLIVMAYAYSYLPNGRISNLLTIPHPGTGELVPLRFSQSMALELILMSTLLGFAVVVVNYWGASAFAQLLGEYSSAFGNRFSWRGRTLVVLLILACAKVIWVIYGFSNQLPKILGGSADYWYNAGVHPALSAIWAGLILTPTTLLAISKIRSGIRDGENVFKQGLAASLGVAVAATYASAVESGSYVLNELITPLRTVNFEAPLYIAHPSLSGRWAAALMSVLGVLIFWRRKPGSAAVFTMVSAVLFLNVLHWSYDPIPFVGLATIDLLVSFAFAFTVAAALVGRRQLPGWVIAGWLAFTVLTHSSGIVPSDLQRRTFEFVLVATFAYTFLWRADELNAMVQRQPNQIVVILGFSALLALVNLVGVIGNDRYGRDFNSSIDLWLNTTDSARFVVAPFLVLVIVVAASGHHYLGPAQPRRRRNA